MIDWDSPDGCTQIGRYRVSNYALAQRGYDQTVEDLGLALRFPVVTSLSGGVVMVKAKTQEEAIEKWLKSK